MNGDPPDEGSALFRQLMRDVVINRSSNRVDTRKPIPEPVPRQRLADEAEVLRELLDGPDPEYFETGETIQYLASGVQQRVLKQLRRGQFRIDGELDLHGLNRHRAREAVADFLTVARDRDFRCLRIIHGKGHRSPNTGPVLKHQLDRWLRKVRDVVAFCSALPKDGGSGAIYVLLKRSNP